MRTFEPLCRRKVLPSSFLRYVLPGTRSNETFFFVEINGDRIFSYARYMIRGETNSRHIRPGTEVECEDPSSCPLKRMPQLRAVI